MGLISKVKTMFTEEIPEEEPIKKEVLHVEIPGPEKIEQEIEEPKENIPVFFDDKDFEELQIKTEPKSSYLKEKPIIKKENNNRIFRPTPIISPVYGVLDKNYHKEDITNKSDKSINYDNKITIDDVRKKAFGTLEDDLETTLFGANSILFNETESVNDDIIENFDNDLLDDLKTEEIVDIKEDIDEPIKEDELFDLIDSMYKGDE